MNEKDFVFRQVEEIKSELKKFPSDFISIESSTRRIKLPGKILMMGEELFGRYEIVTNDGESAFHAENYSAAKFVIYASRAKPLQVELPESESIIAEAVHSYEKYLDEIVRKIQGKFRKYFPDSKNVHQVVNEIFLRSNLIRY